VSAGNSLKDTARQFNTDFSYPGSTLLHDLLRDAFFFVLFGFFVTIVVYGLDTIGLRSTAKEAATLATEHFTPNTILLLTVAGVIIAGFISIFPDYWKKKINPYARHIALRLLGYTSGMCFFLLGFSFGTIFLEAITLPPHFSPELLYFIPLSSLLIISSLAVAFLLYTALGEIAVSRAKATLYLIFMVLFFLSLAV